MQAPGIRLDRFAIVDCLAAPLLGLVHEPLLGLNQGIELFENLVLGQ